MTDLERLIALKRMKRLATSLLAILAVIFLLAFALQNQYPWLGYVRAAAEGGMVGALADWFAVTALFKHPMGLKIPHTAIIPRKKDQIGASLGQFVEENFLSEDIVSQKLESVDVAKRLGTWLSSPKNVQRVADEGAAVIRGALTVLDDSEVQRTLESMARKHLLEPEWSPTLGKLLERVLVEGHHRAAVDTLVERAYEWALANQDTVENLVSQRSPVWMPGFVDKFMGDKVHDELVKFLDAVRQDPNHPLRNSIDDYLSSLAQDMQHSPDMIAKVEAIKMNAISDPQLREMVTNAWTTLKNVLLEAIDDPESELRMTFTNALQDAGQRMASGQELAQKVNAWVDQAARYLVRTYRKDIASIISETVEKWDPKETTEKIELQVGRDLQFIRINGTVVGSLAGLAIFTIATLIFH